VKDDERAYSLGLQAISFRALGTIPSPIFFGLAIDNACITTNGQSGSCHIYDNFLISRQVLFLLVKIGY